MAIIQSCCCSRSLRRGCYFSALYTLIYFAITVITMGHFIEVERRYLNGEMVDPESESFLEPDKITPITVSLNITLLACSSLGLISCGLLVIGVRKDMKYMLLPWIFSMGLETMVEIINLVYLFYLQTEGVCHDIAIQNGSSVEMSLCTGELERVCNESFFGNASSVSLTECEEVPDGVCNETTFGNASTVVIRTECDGELLNFNPVTSFLFTLDFFLILLNIYAIVCVISQFQEYLDGRGTAAFEFNDRQLAAVQYTAAAQHTATATTSSGGRRRSAARPPPSRCDAEEFSEAPKPMARAPGRPQPSSYDPEEFSEAPTKVITSVLAKPSRSAVKKHVQFPDEQSCIKEAPEVVETTVPEEPEKPEGRVISSLWMELESEAPAPER